LWLFGLIIPIAFFTIGGYLSENETINVLPQKEKKIIFVSTSLLFVLLVGLYCIPSYISNNNNNPKESFPQNYDAVQSYSVYGITGELDREHVIARSWYTTDQNFVNDYINVIWSSKIANSNRGNWEFGNVAKTEENAIRSGTEIVGYRKDNYFMPTDEFKGDIARIVLYMYVTYKDDALPTNKININLMKSWAKQDPVDQKERARNILIYATYGYQNRFVETPWLIGFVF
jgi:endonuclease I